MLGAFLRRCLQRSAPFSLFRQMADSLHLQDVRNAHEIGLLVGLTQLEKHVLRCISLSDVQALLTGCHLGVKRKFAQYCHGFLKLFTKSLLPDAVPAFVTGMHELLTTRHIAPTLWHGIMKRMKALQTIFSFTDHSHLPSREIHFVTCGLACCILCRIQAELTIPSEIMDKRIEGNPNE
jgi:hypothetical protein